MFEKKDPYPGLIKLLDSNDNNIILYSMKAIGSLLGGGIESTEDFMPHPHLNEIEGCKGVEKIFNIFKKSNN